jgi:hypothetical protein
MEEDRLSLKRTWVAQKGRSFGFTTIGCLLLAATMYFFVFPIFDKRQIPFDMQILGLLSLLPLGVGLLGMVRRPKDREPATRLAIWLVVLLRTPNKTPIIDMIGAWRNN